MHPMSSDDESESSTFAADGAVVSKPAEDFRLVVMDEPDASAEESSTYPRVTFADTMMVHPCPYFRDDEESTWYTSQDYAIFRKSNQDLVRASLLTTHGLRTHTVLRHLFLQCQRLSQSHEDEESDVAQPSQVSPTSHPAINLIRDSEPQSNLLYQESLQCAYGLERLYCHTVAQDRRCRRRDLLHDVMVQQDVGLRLGWSHDVIANRLALSSRERSQTSATWAVALAVVVL